MYIIIFNMHGIMKKKLIKYIKSLGIEVCTDTNVRGCKGYFSNNKIEISKTIKKEKFVPTLLHEFSHYIHMKIEKNLLQTGGNINAIFNLPAENDNTKIEEVYQEELFRVTNFVDETSLCNILKAYKEKLNKKISKLECKIKKEYPNFKKSKVNEVFSSVINISEKTTLCCNSSIDLTYDELKSAQKEKRRICRCINKYKKYYTTPTELFARFIEGLYIDCDKVKTIAPKAYQRFINLMKDGYYHELKFVFQQLSN